MKYIIYLALFAIAFGNLNSLEPELYNPEGVEFESFLFDKDDVVYTLGTDEVYGKEIWKMNKSKDKMERVTDLPDDADPVIMEILKGKLIFLTSDKNETMLNLWALDSSNTLPVLLTEIEYEHDYLRQFFYEAISRFVFEDRYFINIIRENHGQSRLTLSELWVTDGTVSGTKKIIQNSSDSRIYTYNSGKNVVTFEYKEMEDSTYIKALNSNNEFDLLNTIHGEYSIYNSNYEKFRNNKYYFKIIERNSENEELWVTDGSKIGTMKLISFEDSLKFSGFVYDDLEKVNLIRARSLSEHKKFKLKVLLTDGSKENTFFLKDEKVSEIVGMAKRIDAINNKFLFSTRTESRFDIWSTNGKPEGTTNIYSKEGFNEIRRTFRTPKSENLMYFLVYDSNNVATLIETDGTIENTQEKIDFGNISKTGSSVNLGGSLYEGQLVFVAKSKIYFYNPILNSLRLIKEDSNNSFYMFENFKKTLYLHVSNSFLYFNEHRNSFERIEPIDKSSISGRISSNAILIDNYLYFFADYYNDGYKLYRIDNTFQTVSNVEGQPTDELKLYPNPTGDFLNISVDEPTSVTIIDLTGKVVMSLDNYSGDGINTSDLPAGVYNIILDDNTYGGKFVKE